MGKIKVFLDDVRYPSHCYTYMARRVGLLDARNYLDEWEVVRNYEDFKSLITKWADQIEVISFDHDLADAHYHESMFQNGKVYMKYIEHTSEKTGYDCAKWFVDYYAQKNLELPKILIHSMNPVGCERIRQLIDDEYKRRSRTGTQDTSK